MRYMSLRNFNAARGPPDGEIDETHTPETHFILLARAAQDRNSLAEIVGMVGGDAHREGTRLEQI
jgi:UDP-glucose 4-epimerase